MARAEQQDDHCVIAMHGVSWSIVEVQGHLLFLEHASVSGKVAQSCVDISSVRWDEYYAKAHELFDKHFPGWGD